MKQKLLLSALILLSLASCKKSSTTTTTTTGKNVIIATVDGVTTTYPQASGSNGLSSFSGNYVMNLTSIYYYPNTIELQVSNATPLTVGTYTNTTNANPFYIYYGSYITDNYNNISGTVTITSIDSTNVKGTFSGDVYDAGGSGAKKTITNGSFNVDFQ